MMDNKHLPTVGAYFQQKGNGRLKTIYAYKATPDRITPWRIPRLGRNVGLRERNWNALTKRYDLRPMRVLRQPLKAQAYRRGTAVGKVSRAANPQRPQDDPRDI